MLKWEKKFNKQFKNKEIKKFIKREIIEPLIEEIPYTICVGHVNGFPVKRMNISLIIQNELKAQWLGKGLSYDKKP